MGVPGPIGILGAGHLAGFLIDGLTRGHPATVIHLSPGGRSATLATRSGVFVAPGNQAVVDACDRVIVSLPAAKAGEILAGLRFRDGQKILSAAAGLSPTRLAAAIAPAKGFCTMMPGHANAFGEGPCLLHPADAEMAALLGRLGPVHAFDQETAFQAACSFGGFSGASFSFMAAIINWFEAQGIEPATARALVAETLAGNARVVAGVDRPLAEIVEGIATPGGVTRQCVDEVASAGGFKAWQDALDQVHARLQRGLKEE